MGLPTPEQLEELGRIISPLEFWAQLREVSEEVDADDIVDDKLFKGLQRSPASSHIGYWSLEKQQATMTRFNVPPTPEKILPYQLKNPGFMSATPPPSPPPRPSPARPPRPLTDRGAQLARKPGEAALEHGVKKGVDSLAVSGAAVMGVTFAPVSAAAALWIGVTVVAVQAGKVFNLYTLRDDARSPTRKRTTYYCKCGNCADNIQYIIDKKERNAGVVALSVGTVGIVGIGKKIHSLGKRIKSAIKGEERPKEKVSKAMVKSAREGCLASMAAVFLLSGSWWNGYRDVATMQQAVITLTTEDGWKKFKDNW
ncbi:hypothetical protein GCM10007301_53040 [Azorhizobium oxalatiphilum]|uniref:Uncharacterized protein n=1 Tax=Azorhizobium oxalatiphilum TaxID=980631 RepID=A0A917CHC7_9HYPH|nr:hypothetical protein [Azorhizobium oxalatiphilum]GGF86562.1 hypothetical protein GCM10007301_53040 [Azorhizobium oxalatiphilum]